MGGSMIIEHAMQPADYAIMLSDMQALQQSLVDVDNILSVAVGGCPPSPTNATGSYETGPGRSNL